MRTDFSKPSQDIAKEYCQYLNENKTLLERQYQISALLSSCPERSYCIVCHQSVKNELSFKHRMTDYIKCGICGHIQTQKHPPGGYPTKLNNGITFNQVYPKQSGKEYDLRKKRIYRPKLDWALDCHKELDRSSEEMIDLKWLELGCGAGYFLSALADVGAKNISGVDEDQNLVNRANEALPFPAVECSQSPLPGIIKENEADIYVAFFVLEHLEEARDFFESLSHCPRGTIFYFSVQMFGFATFLESGLDNFSARNLDSVLHTQLYTDSSIRYCLDRAGYAMVAQWIFGQDSCDLVRMLMVSLKDRYPECLLSDVGEQIRRLQDPFQQIIDRHFLSDARHVLAVKR